MQCLILFYVKTEIKWEWQIILIIYLVIIIVLFACYYITFDTRGHITVI